MRAHLSMPHTLDSLARRSAMSPRTLQREFRAATGLAPYQWLTRERVARARELLESSALPPARIAQMVGLRSEEALRHHFRRQVGTAPARYRRQRTQTGG
jgi:AraC family transcriptional activator FtrA